MGCLKPRNYKIDKIHRRMGERKVGKMGGCSEHAWGALYLPVVVVVVSSFFVNAEQG